MKFPLCMNYSGLWIVHFTIFTILFLLIHGVVTENFYLLKFCWNNVYLYHLNIYSMTYFCSDDRRSSTSLSYERVVVEGFYITNMGIFGIHRFCILCINDIYWNSSNIFSLCDLWYPLHILAVTETNENVHIL